MSFENIGRRETLPEKVYAVIKEAILSGGMKEGDSLPTEPELEEQFGVSRAVIRDAVRMLKAQGLIDVRHGKGMFVSASQIEAFTDALVTTLRRDNATVWDVEQFEKIFLPQVFALASSTATKEHIARIRKLGDKYKKSYRELIESRGESTGTAYDDYRNFILAVFDGTGNKMIRILGEVLLSMRKWRNITGDDDYEKIIALENAAIDTFIAALETSDPIKAAEIVSELLKYDDTIAAIMKQTPIGTSPEIPADIFYSSWKI